MHALPFAVCCILVRLGKMPPAKTWYLKIEEGFIYMYKGMKHIAIDKFVRSQNPSGSK